MGKKNKLFKSGLPRNQIKKNKEEKIRIELAKAKLLSQKKDNIPTTNKNNKNQVLKIKTPIVNYNLDSLKKVNDSLGLTKEQIDSLYSRPLRNRRYVNNLVLTRREKKKEMRKQKKEIKLKMEEKTKLDITLNPNLHKKNDFCEKNLGDKKNPKNNKTTLGFDFGEMNDIIMDIGKKESKKENLENKMKDSRISKQKNLIYTEANKINKVLNNKEFLSNPNQAMKTEIQENQRINERNKKIREEFNKNYNLLNLK